MVKICDFGSAKRLDKKLNTPYIVSRYYRAPELILACSDYTNAIDVWAIGCIFMEFLTLRPLFPGKSEGSQLLEQVAILGKPNQTTLKGMSESNQISDSTLMLVDQLDDIPTREFLSLMPIERYEDSHKEDLRLAADLISKMVRWKPS